MTRFTPAYWKGMSLQTLPYLIVTVPWALALFFMLRDNPRLVGMPLFWVTAILPIAILGGICSRIDR